MEKTDNGRKHGQLVVGVLPRQTAAERRQKSFAMAVEEFHCDKSGQLFMEAFNALAPPKRPHSPDAISSHGRGGSDPRNSRSGPLGSSDDPNESAA